MTIGRTLKMFVMGRDARAFKSIELANWSGFAFMGTRQHIEQARHRKELSEPAVYMLFNDGSDELGIPNIYIGEAEDFSERIQDHMKKPEKEWFTDFIVFVSRDKNLTKAHVKYLELELYKLAKRSVGTVAVKNLQTPTGASLPESDLCTMNEFKDNIIFILESLGLSYFQSEVESDIASTINKIKNKIEGSNSLDGTEFYITLPKDLGAAESNLTAKMQVVNGLYILKSGSVIRKKTRDGFKDHAYRALWEKIIASDAVTECINPNLLITTRDIEFKSPSGAGTIVRGGQTNGRTEWKRTLDDKDLNECEMEVLTA